MDQGTSNIRAAYEASNREHGHVADKAQLDVIARYEDLLQRIAAQPTRRRGRLRAFLLRKEARAPVRGLYVWGGVGRGKTFLMDLFFENLDLKQKKRIQ